MDSGPGAAKPAIAPEQSPSGQGRKAPVEPSNASENAQGNEVREEDIELTDADASDEPLAGGKADSRGHQGDQP